MMRQRKNTNLDRNREVGADRIPEGYGEKVRRGKEKWEDMER
jgi:hypothetical protein